MTRIPGRKRHIKHTIFYSNTENWISKNSFSSEIRLFFRRRLRRFGESCSKSLVLLTEFTISNRQGVIILVGLQILNQQTFLLWRTVNLNLQTLGLHPSN